MTMMMMMMMMMMTMNLRLGKNDGSGGHQKGEEVSSSVRQVAILNGLNTYGFRFQNTS
jgi:hypothetical protein